MELPRSQVAGLEDLTNSMPNDSSAVENHEREGDILDECGSEAMVTGGATSGFHI